MTPTRKTQPPGLRNPSSAEHSEQAGRPASRLCTWVDCRLEAMHPQERGDGGIWANLCQSHHDELESCLASLDPRKLLSSWIKAQGGAKKAAQRI